MSEPCLLPRVSRYFVYGSVHFPIHTHIIIHNRIRIRIRIRNRNLTFILYLILVLV